jgi:broad specificity polyphosphatase/5'/3'-nucleotidase SurE
VTPNLWTVPVRSLVAGWDARACLNVNVPHAASESACPLTLTRQGVGLIEAIDVAERTDPRGLAYYWLQFRRGSRPKARRPRSRPGVSPSPRCASSGPTRRPTPL